MSNESDELRRLLRERADGLPTQPELPPAVLGRVRRRLARNAVGVVAIVVAEFSRVFLPRRPATGDRVARGGRRLRRRSARRDELRLDHVHAAGTTEHRVVGLAGPSTASGTNPGAADVESGWGIPASRVAGGDASARRRGADP